MLPKHVTEFKSIFSNKYLTLYHVPVSFEDIKKDYYVASYGTRAGVLVFRDGKVLLTKQYRLLINDYSLEIPGGKVEEGELPEDAAIRECLEETGVLCSNLRHLVTYHPGLDNIYNPTHVFVTGDSEDTNREGLPENNEVVGYQWVDFDECVDMLANGRIADIFSMIAIHTYLHTNCREGTTGLDSFKA